MSDYAIEKTTVTAQPVLSQRFQVTPEQLGSKLAEVLPAIFGYASSGAATIVGQPFSRYHAMGPKLDVEAGIPVAAAAESRGEIVSAELPGGAAATTMHTGPYDTLHEAHAALAQWAEANGHAPSGAPWEVYVTDPGSEPDPNKWQTRVYLPL